MRDFIEGFTYTIIWVALITFCMVVVKMGSVYLMGGLGAI